VSATIETMKKEEEGDKPAGEKDGDLAEVIKNILAKEMNAKVLMAVLGEQAMVLADLQVACKGVAKVATMA